MKDIQKLQAQFMDACSQSRHTDFSYPPEAVSTTLNLWRGLICEEFGELISAIDDVDAVLECNLLEGYEDALDTKLLDRELSEVCAEAVDLVYVTMGLMNLLGLPFMEMFNVIHEANMAKCVDGKVIKNPAGKVLKPDGWKPADKLQVILNAIEGKTNEN